MIHVTPVALSIYDEDYQGLDLYMMTPAATRMALEAPGAGEAGWRGEAGAQRMAAFLRVLLEHVGKGWGKVDLATTPAVQSPWAPLSKEVQALGEAILSARGAMFRGLQAVTLSIEAPGGEAAWALRLSFRRNAPWQALYAVEAMLAAGGEDIAPYRKTLTEMLALGAVLAALHGVRARRGSQAARWAAYALVRMSLAAYALVQTSLLFWEAGSEGKAALSSLPWRKIKARVRDDILGGYEMRLNEAGLVDGLRSVMYAGELVWQPKALVRWARSGGEVRARASGRGAGDSAFTSLEMSASLALALKGARTGRVRVDVPVKEGSVRRLQVPSPGAAELAWPQALELVWGEVSDSGLDWLSGGEMPERGGQALLEGDVEGMRRFVGAPSFAMEEGEVVEQADEGREVYTQFADRAVEDARAHRRYVPGGQGFLLGLSRIAPPGLRRAGVEALAVWAEADGLWLRLIAPEAPSDGVMVRWRALRRLEERLSSWTLAAWARSEVDLVCAMLWRDLVTEGTQVLQREGASRSGRRRRRGHRKAAAEPSAASPAAARPSRRVRLLPRRYARGASWVRWGTTEEHRTLRSPHWVIGHLRLLPPGRRRSRASEQEAERYGILLPDNPRVTFVRPHVRGGKAPEGAEAAPEVRSRGLMTLVSLFQREGKEG